MTAVAAEAPAAIFQRARLVELGAPVMPTPELAPPTELAGIGYVNYDVFCFADRDKLRRAGALAGENSIGEGTKTSPEDNSPGQRALFLKALGAVCACGACTPETIDNCAKKGTAGNIRNILGYLSARTSLTVAAISEHGPDYNFNLTGADPSSQILDLSVWTPHTTRNLVITAPPSETKEKKRYDRAIRRGLKPEGTEIVQQVELALALGHGHACTIISSAPHPDKLLEATLSHNVATVVYSPGGKELKPGESKLRENIISQLQQRTKEGLKNVVGYNKEEHEAFTNGRKITDVMKDIDDLFITDGAVGVDYIHRDALTGELLHLKFRNSGQGEKTIIDPIPAGDGFELEVFVHVEPSRGVIPYLSSLGAGDRFLAIVIEELIKLYGQPGKGTWNVPFTPETMCRIVRVANNGAIGCLGHKGSLCDVETEPPCDCGASWPANKALAREPVAA